MPNVQYVIERARENSNGQGGMSYETLPEHRMAFVGKCMTGSSGIPSDVPERQWQFFEDLEHFHTVARKH